MTLPFVYIYGRIRYDSYEFCCLLSSMPVILSWYLVIILYRSSVRSVMIRMVTNFAIGKV